MKPVVSLERLVKVQGVGVFRVEEIDAWYVNSVRESPASDSILDLTLCLPSMRPIRRLRPTLLRNRMMFIRSYLHHIVTGGDIFLWIGEYHQSLLSTISMSGGTPRSELQKWLLWCRITRSRFSLVKII